jgi:hypothetical protein
MSNVIDRLYKLVVDRVLEKGPSRSRPERLALGEMGYSARYVRELAGGTKLEKQRATM